MRRFVPDYWALWLMVVILISGCAGTSPPTTFYMMDGIGNAQKSIGGKPEAPAILIGPITLPAYLDRTQMVTRSMTDELKIDEYHRWAEPLRDSFYRILQENISVALNTAAVFTFPQQHGVRPAIQVLIDVTRFDTDADGKARLVAFWSLKQGNGQLLTTRKTAVDIDPISDDYQGRITAQNEILGQLSREVSTTISGLLDR